MPQCRPASQAGRGWTLKLTEETPLKRATFVLASLLLTSQAATAQPLPGAPHHGSPVDELARDLNLSETQKAQVRQAFEAERVKRDAERTRFKASGQERTPALRRAKMQELEHDLQKQLSGVLTAEQMETFKQFEDEHRHHHPRGGQPASSSPVK
jgi:Spy/CpxP family protein refolding chaperone